MFLIVVNWKVYVLSFVFTFYLNIYPSFKHEINVEEGDFPEIETCTLNINKKCPEWANILAEQYRLFSLKTQF